MTLENKIQFNKVSPHKEVSKTVKKKNMSNKPDKDIIIDLDDYDNFSPFTGIYRMKIYLKHQKKSYNVAI